MQFRLPLSLFAHRDGGDDAQRSPRRGGERVRDGERDTVHLRELRDTDPVVASRGFEGLFGSYHSPLCDLAFRYLHSREEGQDVVQDVFTRLWRGRASLLVTDSIGAYLRAATRNLALNRLRHARVEGIDGDDPLRVVHDDLPAADETLERAERHAAIARAIGDLPVRRRAICVLRWGQGLSYAEIAQRLGIGERTVETQLRRAILAIRAGLARE